MSMIPSPGAIGNIAATSCSRIMSGHLIRIDMPAISDGQLWQIARDAADEMTADRKQYGIDNLLAEPTAMGILAVGNEIILASSMKGGGSFFYDFSGGDTTVVKSLAACQLL